MRHQRARDAGGKARDAEGETLVAVKHDAVAARRHVVVADRAQGAAKMRAEQAPLKERKQDQRAKRDFVDPRATEQRDAE